MTAHRTSKGTAMAHETALHAAVPHEAVLHDEPLLHAWDLEDLVIWEQLMTTQPTERPRPVRARRRPAGPVRPGGAPLRHHGTGVARSTAPRPQRRRPITPATTVGLALLAAIITVWLGLVAHFGDAARTASAPIPDRLAVVQVKAGESLQHVAARVAPDAPVGQVIDRIRELNELDTSALAAGQTLIAPVG